MSELIHKLMSEELTVSKSMSKWVNCRAIGRVNSCSSFVFQMLNEVMTENMPSELIPELIHELTLNSELIHELKVS